MAEDVTSFMRLIKFDLAIGESPVWDDRRRVLWFVDILAPAIYALDTSTGEVSTYPMPRAVGSISLCLTGRLVVAMSHGVHLFNPASGSLDFLVNPEPDMPMNRLNDGKVGPDGCFWVGSMHDSIPRAPTGALYRITPSGSCTRVVSDLFVSNGLAWSPDGRTMYHADSRGSYVRAYDFDKAIGAISNARVIATPQEEDGLPDGAAVDIEGNYWSAGITADRINRISPRGGIIDSFPVPVAAPTMPCFGGRDMRTLFITSLTAERRGQRVGGTLISCEMDVPGVAIGRFG